MGGSFHCNHQESLFTPGTESEVPREGSLRVLMAPSSPDSQEPTLPTH